MLNIKQIKFMLPPLCCLLLANVADCSLEKDSEKDATSGQDGIKDGDIYADYDRSNWKDPHDALGEWTPSQMDSKEEDIKYGDEVGQKEKIEKFEDHPPAERENTPLQEQKSKMNEQQKKQQQKQKHVPETFNLPNWKDPHDALGEWTPSQKDSKEKDIKYGDEVGKKGKIEKFEDHPPTERENTPLQEQKSKMNEQQKKQQQKQKHVPEMQTTVLHSEYNCKSVCQEGTQGINDKTFFRHFVREFHEKMERLDGEEHKYGMEVMIYQDDYNALKKLLDDKESSNKQILDAIVNAFQPLSRSPFAQMTVEQSMPAVAIVFGLILVLALSYILLTQPYRLWWYLFVLFFVAFLVSVPWEWYRMYKIALSKKSSDSMKLPDVPDDCRPGKISPWSSVKLWMKNQFSLSDDECEKYHESILVDPIWEVTPLQAFSVCSSRFFLEPLKQLASAMGECFRLFFKEIPTQWQPIVFISLFVIVVLFIIMSTGAEIRMPLLHITFGGARQPLQDRRLGGHAIEAPHANQQQLQNQPINDHQDNHQQQQQQQQQQIQDQQMFNRQQQQQQQQLRRRRRQHNIENVGAQGIDYHDFPADRNEDDIVMQAVDCDFFSDRDNLISRQEILQEQQEEFENLQQQQQQQQRQQQNLREGEELQHDQQDDQEIQEQENEPEIQQQQQQQQNLREGEDLQHDQQDDQEIQEQMNEPEAQQQRHEEPQQLQRKQPQEVNDAVESIHIPDGE